MFCSQCGKEIPQNAQFCPECQQKVAPAPVNQVEIKSGLVQAILVTLFCCLPFGIVAIVYAAKVSGLVAAGDIAGAREAAKKSNMWSWISFGVGLVVQIIAFIINLIPLLFCVQSNSH